MKIEPQVAMCHSLVDPVELHPARAKTAKAGGRFSPSLLQVVTTAILGAGGELLCVVPLVHALTIYCRCERRSNWSLDDAALVAPRAAPS